MKGNLKSLRQIRQEVEQYSQMAVSVDCVIFGFDDDKLKVLLIRSDLQKFSGKWSLLGDLVDHREDIEEAAYRVLLDRTGMDDLYLEQVKAFGGVRRHPGGRVITIAFYSLINIHHHKLKILDNELHWHDLDSARELAFDHREILDTCYSRLQKRIQEDPLVFSLLPSKFSMRELQSLYEAILGVKLDRRNFRKKLFSMDYLVDVDEMESEVSHRPGKLYKFDFRKYEQNKEKWGRV